MLRILLVLLIRLVKNIIIISPSAITRKTHPVGTAIAIRAVPFPPVFAFPADITMPDLIRFNNFIPTKRIPIIFTAISMYWRGAFPARAFCLSASKLQDHENILPIINIDSQVCSPSFRIMNPGGFLLTPTFKRGIKLSGNPIFPGENHGLRAFLGSQLFGNLLCLTQIKILLCNGMVDILNRSIL